MPHAARGYRGGCKTGYGEIERLNKDEKMRMESVYSKTISMLLMIALGYVLKREKIVMASDARVLSKIIIHVTLPCVILTNLNGIEIRKDLINAILIGFVVNLLLTGIALWLTRKESKELKCLYLFSIPLFNISGYAIPIAQSYVTDREIAALLLFNLGTTVFTYVIVPFLAGHLCFDRKDGAVEGFRSLYKNVPAVVSCGMILLCLWHIVLPTPVIDFFKTFASANTPLAMLSIGILLEISREWNIENVKAILCRLLAVILIGVLAFHMPFLGETVKKVLLIAFFSPMVSCAPFLAIEQGYKGTGIASVNSAYLPVSMITTAILLCFLF